MKILVGISGSIGVLGIHAYLISLLAQKEVEEVRAVMTPTATRFVSPRALEALIGKAVAVDPWTDSGKMVSPPELVQGADLYLIAPASATTLSRCASGSAETLVSNCYLCFTGPVAFAPAMAPEMWDHPAVRRNLDRLQQDGALILPAGVGFSAALGKSIKGALCAFPQMWPQLKSLVEKRQETLDPSKPLGDAELPSGKA
ncbi:MAG TPA: flavoprotein [Thermoanaerobaculia bacterium]|jgi:phosphopantothenoylcysteine decarboxylase/phosphopantothenate--cysteine ligase|nr:flavoprotein [Thermoanaerobaculia bacterium]